jgi:hypothetical protein
MKINAVIIDSDVFMISLKIGVGINNTISISNTIKIIANMKNRKENGTRALFLGSNPHSKGDIFSRSDVDREFSALARINNKKVIVSASKDVVIGKYIYSGIYNIFF